MYQLYVNKTAPFFVFLGPHLQHMEVPRLGVKSELRLPAYATATAMWDPSRICEPIKKHAQGISHATQKLSPDK